MGSGVVCSWSASVTTESGCKRDVSLPPDVPHGRVKPCVGIPPAPGASSLPRSQQLNRSEEPRAVRVAFAAWEGARGLPARLPSG